MQLVGIVLVRVVSYGSGIVSVGAGLVGMSREREREREREKKKKVGWSWLNVRTTRRLYTLQCNIVKEFVVLR